MLNAFKNWLEKEKRYSKHTVKSYLNDISQFQKYLLKTYPDIDLKNADLQIVRSWIVFLIDNQLSKRTVNRKIVSLNSFYKYLEKEEVVKENPVKNIQGFKTAERIVKYLEIKEIIQILDNFEFKDDFDGIRDKLILEMLYGTGMRLSELLNLKVHDLESSISSLKVLGKRNKERIIPINATLKELILKYLKVRKENFENDQTGHFFLSSKGKQLYPMFVYRVVKKYLDQQSDRINVSPHVLRHSFATHLLSKGADINAIKELLGHANLAATQVYTHNTIERLKKVFKQAHPRG